jgi:hypothetical protein
MFFIWVEEKWLTSLENGERVRKMAHSREKWWGSEKKILLAIWAKRRLYVSPKAKPQQIFFLTPSPFFSRMSHFSSERSIFQTSDPFFWSEYKKHFLGTRSKILWTCVDNRDSDKLLSLKLQNDNQVYYWVSKNEQNDFKLQ